MSKVSFILPCRGETHKIENETFLQRTIRDIYNNATGEFEVIVGFNGPPYQNFPNWPNLKIIKLPKSVGVKMMINVLAATASGKYIYKSDSHCSFSKGIDEILQLDMEDDWIVTPRFKILNPSTWELQYRNGEVEFYDYFYLCCPLTDPRGFRFKAGGHWGDRTKERIENYPNIDETPQIHGSGWFMTRDRYFELGGFPNIDPYGHAQEPIWLALKNWLMGGRVMVNKKTWYAHLHQSNEVKGYHYTRKEERYTYDWTARHWMLNKEPNLIHDIQWFVNIKFPNMPTWPSNWKGEL